MIPFRKMNGLGNDFVLFDARGAPVRFSPAQARILADRHVGIGGDQVLTLRSSQRADVFLQIQNIDGSEVDACGNAVRCVARLLFDEHQHSPDSVTIETLGGIHRAQRVAENAVCVDLGVPRFAWRDIPLSKPADTLRLDLHWSSKQGVSVAEPCVLSMGNPHAVFFVDDVEALPIERMGPQLEHDAWFPQRANIGFAQLLSPSKIRLRVWERYAGLTRACGTGACAALVAANRRGLAERSADVVLDGGTLRVDWRDDDHVLTTGATMLGFEGQVSGDLLALLQSAQGTDDA